MSNERDFTTLWGGDYISVVSPTDAAYEAVLESDMVQVIPVDVPLAEVIIRRETCPPYTLREPDGGYEQFYTVVSGGIEDGETATETALREVQEEIGIDVQAADYELIQLTPEGIPYTKGTAARVTLFALMLFSYQTEEPEGDGTPYEELSTFERVPLQQIDEVLLTSQADLLLHCAIAKLKNVILLELAPDS